MRVSLRNVGLNLVGQLLPMSVALIAMPVLVRDAGPDRLGFLGLAWALIGYFALLDLGLSRVVTRRIAVADGRGTLVGETRALVRLSVQLFLAVSAVSAIMAITVPAHVLVGKDADPIVVDEARLALLILWATLPLTVVIGLLRGALEGLQQFGRANLLRAVFGAWSFAAPLAVFPWSHALGPLTAAIALGRVLSLVAHAVWASQALREREALHRRTPEAAPEAPMPNALELFREGGWLTVSNVVGPMMVTFDRFAIASLVSLAAASYYFVPQEVSLRMLVVPSAIATTIFPMLARIDHTGLDRYRITTSALQAVAATCLPPCAIIAMFATPLLSLWMGPAFAAESGMVAACLAVGLFTNCFAQVPFAWIQAAGRSDVTGKLHLAQLPVYVVLLFSMVTEFGIVGAAIAWSLRAMVDATLLYVAAARLFPDVVLRPTMRPIVVGTLLLAALAATAWIGDPTLRRWVSFALFAACLAIAARVGLRLALARWRS